MSIEPDVVSLTGIGESEIGKVPGRSGMALGVQAVLRALDDAGLAKDDVDGIFVLDSYLDWHVRYSTAFAEYLGLDASRLRVVETMGLGSASSSGHAVQQAAIAISAGACEVAVVVAADSFRSFGGAGRAGRDAALTGLALNRNKEFENPYGPLVAATFALAATRYLSDYGLDGRALAHVAVTSREYARRNPRAQMRDRPISVEDVLNSPMISDPLHKFDCSLISDGGCAVVLEKSGRRAEAVGREVTIRASEIAYGDGRGRVHDSYSQSPSIYNYRTGVAEASRRARESAGMAREDVGVLFTYDPFTIVPLLYVEGLGYCEEGEAAQLFESGFFGPGGEVTWNPHGGLLSYCHPGFPGGLFMFTEAVRQLREEADGYQSKRSGVAMIQGYGAQMGIFPSTILSASAA